MFGRICTRGLLLVVPIAVIGSSAVGLAAVPVTKLALTGGIATGAPANQHFDSLSNVRLSPHGTTAFHAGLTGFEVDNSNNSGIWAEGTGGVMDMVVRSGNQAPGLPEGVTFTGFGDPIANANANLAFFATLTGDGIEGVNHSIWTANTTDGSLSMLTREAMHPPGTSPDVRFFSFDTFREPAFNAAGDIAFAARLNGNSIDANNNVGIWSTREGVLDVRARSGTQAPDTPDGVVFGSTMTAPLLNGSGRIAFMASLAGLNAEVTNNLGIWSDGLGAMNLVARTGSHAPGTLPAVTFKGLSDPSGFNDVGQLSFAGTLAGLTVIAGINDSGVWAGTSNDLRLVARAGDGAPDTGFGLVFREFFGPVVLNSAGHAAFVATLAGPGLQEAVNDLGIWSEGTGNLRLVARLGSHAPGTPDGVSFLFFSGDPTINAAGHVAFSAETSAPGLGNSFNASGIWAETDRGLTLLIGTGDTIPVSDTASKTIENVFLVGGSGQQDGRVTGFDDNGDIAFVADFTDGSSGVFSTVHGAGGVQCGTCGVGAPMSLTLAGPLVMATKRARRRRRR